MVNRPTKSNKAWNFETLLSYISLLSSEQEKYMRGSLDGIREHAVSYETASALTSQTISDNLALQKEFLLTAVRALEVQSLQRFDAMREAYSQLEKLLNVKMAAAEQAVLKAEEASEKRANAVNDRFSTVNEFRAQLGDQAATFLPRNEYTAATQAINEKLDILDHQFSDKLMASTKVMDDKISVSFKTLSDKIDDLKSFRDATQGKNQVVTAGWGQLFGIIVALGAIPGILTFLITILKK